MTYYKRCYEWQSYITNLQVYSHFNFNVYNLVYELSDIPSSLQKIISILLLLTFVYDRLTATGTKKTFVFSRNYEAICIKSLVMSVAYSKVQLNSSYLKNEYCWKITSYFMYTNNKAICRKFICLYFAVTESSSFSCRLSVKNSFQQDFE